MTGTGHCRVKNPLTKITISLNKRCTHKLSVLAEFYKVSGYDMKVSIEHGLADSDGLQNQESMDRP